MTELILNISVMALLILTIFFCWRLNNKIGELRAGRRDLIELVRTLDAAIIKTNSNIANLKTMSQTSAHELSETVAKAQELLNDLGFIVDTGSKVADRLERSIASSRNINVSSAASVQSHSQSYPHSHSNLNPNFANNNLNRSSEEKAVVGTKSVLAKTRDELLAALKFSR